jgi:hypothetical protein
LIPIPSDKPLSFDSGYCKGPYACNVPTCVIYGVSDDSQPAFRTPAACPVAIEDSVTDKLWVVTQQANYRDDPVTVAVETMRHGVQCQACSTCGQMPTEVRRLWPLMQNYTDWGRGCARECSELSRAYGEIFDFLGSDVSGNLPKLTFKDCQPRRIVQFGIARASYGDCLRCPETTDACGAGFYYKTCDASLKPS